jgi:hypothetical protein
MVSVDRTCSSTAVAIRSQAAALQCGPERALVLERGLGADLEDAVQEHPQADFFTVETASAN